MPHYHVFLRREGEDSPRLWQRDLTADQVRERLVKPYRKGAALVDGGAIVPVSTLRQVRIARTDVPFEDAYKERFEAFHRELEKLNRGSGVFFASPGPGHDEMADGWPDVTSEFLKGEPPGAGGKPSAWQTITNNRFLSSLIVGLILALVYWLFGIKK